MNGIKNIIFDLGGVLLNIDYNKTIEAFKGLGISKEQITYSQKSQSSLFDDFETGKISSEYFINQLLGFASKNCSPNQLVAAWNAMLYDFRGERLNELKLLNEKYRCVIFSNTNHLHQQAFERKLKLQLNAKLEDYVSKVYYSHIFSQRKPHASSFLALCSLENFIPAETLFIDDSIQHIQGAQKAGLKTFHYTQNESFFNIIS